MILEEETYRKFGYYPSELLPKSKKKILATCADCGKIRITSKNAFRPLCSSCGHKGENNPRWKGGKIKRICEVCGKRFKIDLYMINKGQGIFCSTKCMGDSYTKSRKGENNPAWKGGLSFEPYCHKFNNEFKEYIRDKFGRVCFLCPKTEEENTERLSVHHVNYNKNCGCDGDLTCQFVPLCRSCNAKVNSNRKEWEKKIKQKIQNKLNGWYI